MMRKIVARFRKAKRLKEVKEKKEQHSAEMHSQAWKQDSGYQDYLDNQLERTLIKQNTPLRPHIAINIDKIAASIDLSKASVLCVGCRNMNEINYFDEKGAASVIGIDIFSENDRIKVMDMHEMTFQDDTFDVIYSAHSLEHAYNPQIVANEFMRVGRTGALLAIEVPNDFEVSKTDLYDYGTVSKLHDLFKAKIKDVLWAETILAQSGDNIHGTSVIRTGFTIR